MNFQKHNYLAIKRVAIGKRGARITSILSVKSIYGQIRMSLSNSTDHCQFFNHISLRLSPPKKA